MLATLIWIAGSLVVLILVARILLTVGEASPANGITQLVTQWADRLHLGFRGLFTPGSPKTQAALDYGLPAAIWLIATWVLARLVRRIGG